MVYEGCEVRPFYRTFSEATGAAVVHQRYPEHGARAFLRTEFNTKKAESISSRPFYFLDGSVFWLPCAPTQRTNGSSAVYVFPICLQYQGQRIAL